MIGQAEQLAAKTSTLASSGERLKTLYQRTLARNPDDEELRMANDFLVAAQSAKTSAPEPALVLPVWRYGYGSLAADSNAVRFKPLPHFTGKAWQGSAQFPDPALAFTNLNAVGGHPGNDQTQCTIIRWVSPIAGTVAIEV